MLDMDSETLKKRIAELEEELKHSKPPRPIELLSGAQIREIREREAITQAMFAVHLNVTKNQVSAWECERKKPSGTALKLLNIVKYKGIAAICDY